MKNRMVSIATLAACVCFHPAFPQEPAVYTWVRTAPLETARHDGCAQPIAGNRILVAGGVGGEQKALASVEIYQEDLSFRTGPSMAFTRSHHACVVLNDGRVLAAGGKNGGQAVDSAEIYDPVENVWTPTANPPLARWGQTATLFDDGRVLLAGGESGDGVSDRLELFDPATNRFELLAAKLSSPRRQHAAVLRLNGFVLVVGGNDGSNALGNTDFFDPEKSEVAPGPELPGARASHTATALLDGTTLVVGGTDGGQEVSSTLLLRADSSFWDLGPSLKAARQGHAALRIPNNGNVLIVGGSANEEAIASSELYRVDNEIQEAGPLTLARAGLMMAAREDGVVLAAGGSLADGPFAGCGTFIPPTMSLNKIRYVRNESIAFSAKNLPINADFQIRRSETNFIGSLVGTTTATGTISRSLANQGIPGQVSIVRLQIPSNASIVLEASYRTVVRTTTILTVSPPAGSTYGNTLTFNVEVRPEEVNGQMAGAITINRLVQASPAPAPPVPAPFIVMNSVSPLPGTFGRNIAEFGFFAHPAIPAAGLYNFSASFQENNFYAGSTSATVSNYTVGRGSTLVTLTPSPNPPVAGGPATPAASSPRSGTTWTAEVRRQITTATQLPVGSVRFTVAATGQSFTATLDSSNPPKATAAFRMPGGTHSVLAEYLGSSNHLPSLQSFNGTVRKANSVMTFTGGENCVQSTVCPVTVSLAGDPIPTGTVTVSTLPSITATLNNGQAVLNTFPLLVPVTNLTTGAVVTYRAQRAFSYTGDDFHESALQLKVLTVRKFDSVIDPPVIGTAVVNGDILFFVRLSGGTIPPAGPVSVSAPGNSDFSASSLNSGTLVRVRYSTAGPKTVTATYAGDEFFTSATTTFTINVQ